MGTVHVTNSKPESLKGKLRDTKFEKPFSNEMLLGIQIECSGLAEVRFPVKNDKNMEFRCSKEQYFDFKFSLYNPG